MIRSLAIATALCISGWVVSSQTTSSSARLSQIADTLVAGRGRGAPPPDAEALLATLKDMKAAELSPAEHIDRRFAETILVGREISAEHRSGPMGKDAYTRMLREQYLLPYDADTLWAYAWGEFDRTIEQLEALAKTIDPHKSWLDIANDVKRDHPDPLLMIEAHQQVVDRARAHLVAQDLMPIPWPERCTVVVRQRTPGNNPYYGNFSGASSRAPALDGTFIGEWQINPFDPSWDEQTKHDYLLEHDWALFS